MAEFAINGKGIPKNKKFKKVLELGIVWQSSLLFKNDYEEYYKPIYYMVKNF